MSSSEPGSDVSIPEEEARLLARVLASLRAAAPRARHERSAGRDGELLALRDEIGDHTQFKGE